MENSVLGNRIKSLREEHKLNQIEFAKILNISNTTLSQYETGQRVPSDEIKAKIADHFGVSVDYLLGRTDIRNTKGTSMSPPAITGILKQKDVKDIEEDLKEMEKKLLNSEGLMLNGELATPEAIQSILDAMRIGLEMAKQRNKQKYTPDKYKK